MAVATGRPVTPKQTWCSTRTLTQEKPFFVQEAKKDKSKNIMRDLRIRKLCLNICVGESGDRLTRAAKVCYLELLIPRQCFITRMLV